MALFHDTAFNKDTSSVAIIRITIDEQLFC